MHNVRQISAMLKISNMHSNNGMLHTINWHSTLLSNEHHRNHEVTRVYNSEENGCYIVCDKRRCKFERAGSSSNRIGHEIEHTFMQMKVRNLKIKVILQSLSR